MRFLSLELQTLDPGSGSPVQRITVSPRAPAAPSTAPGTIWGGALPPRTPRFLFSGALSDLKKLSVWARFRLRNSASGPDLTVSYEAKPAEPPLLRTYGWTVPTSIWTTEPSGNRPQGALITLPMDSSYDIFLLHLLY